MGFLSNLFGSKRQVDEEKQPDNSKLIFLLNIHSEHRSDKNSELILREVTEGNCFFMLPILAPSDNAEGSATVVKDLSQVTFLSSFEADGLIILGVFTDSLSLTKFSKAPTAYITMAAKALLQLANENKIHKIVINMDSANAYVLERQKSMGPVNHKPNARIAIGQLHRPLRSRHEDRIVASFATVPNILEAYQFAKHVDDEYFPTIGMKLESYAEIQQEIAVDALTKTLTGEFARTKLQIMFLEDDAIYQIVSKVESGHFYTRSESQ